MLRSLFLAGVFLAAGTIAAQAQALIDGTNVDEIVNLARGYGAASMLPRSSLPSCFVT